MSESTLTGPRIRYRKDEAAYMLSVSERKIDQLRSQGKLIGRLDGKNIFFDHEELVSYSRACRADEAGA